MKKIKLFLLLVFSSTWLFSQEKFPKYSDVQVPPKEAQFWEKLPNSFVKCELCPWRCTIAPKQRGLCRTRENINGKLYALTYARPCTINVDPIEKKPFFHVLPGKNAFSIAVAGCNVGCKFCQNWQISKIAPDESSGEKGDASN